jgi:hypothetical protein
MTDQYFGTVSFDGSEDTIYLEMAIDDLDSPAWIGIGTAGQEVPGITTVGEYCVKLIDKPNPRRGQTATAGVEIEVENGVLRFVGRTPFQ